MPFFSHKYGGFSLFFTWIFMPLFARMKVKGTLLVNYYMDNGQTNLEIHTELEIINSLANLKRILENFYFPPPELIHDRPEYKALDAGNDIGDRMRFEKEVVDSPRFREYRNLLVQQACQYIDRMLMISGSEKTEEQIKTAIDSTDALMPHEYKTILYNYIDSKK